METINKQSNMASLRLDILEMIYHAKGGHTGGSLSVLDILAVLYGRILNVDPKSPQNPDRDRLILSKGHSVEAYYAVLAEYGFFPKTELNTYGDKLSRLFGHPTMKVPGVEAATGALGHGLSIGVGIALGAKRLNKSFHTFVIMGDGELAEGSVWEAAMSASHYHLDNLTAVIDYNKLQISGPVDSVMNTTPLNERWVSFGWNVIEVDGHDLEALEKVLQPQTNKVLITNKPLLIIAHTIKGKGVSFIEGQAAWHHKVPTFEQLLSARKDLSR